MSFDFSTLVVPQVVTDIFFTQLGAKSCFIGTGAAAIVRDSQGRGGHYVARRSQLEDGNHNVVITGTPLSGTTLDAVADIGPVCRRARVRYTVDGEGAAQGGRLAENATAAIIDQSSSWWANELDGILLDILAAGYGTAGCLLANHLHDASSDSPSPIVPYTFSAIVNAAAKLGDEGVNLAAVVVHSAQLKDLLTESGQRANFVPLAGQPLTLTIAGLRIIVSDRVPTSGSGSHKKYDAILVRPGSLWLDVQQDLRELVAVDPTLPGIRYTETMHVGAGISGLRFGAVVNPDSTALATPGNWSLTVSPATTASTKSVGLVALRTNAS